MTLLLSFAPRRSLRRKGGSADQSALSGRGAGNPQTARPHPPLINLLHLALIAALALTGLARAARADSFPDAARIVGVGGSVTEIIHALGQSHRLVARDSTSVYPPELAALPDIGYVRRLSPEGLLSVNPDLIIAEHDAGPPEAVALLAEAAIPYITLPEAQDGPGILAKIAVVADALGVPEQGRQLQAKVAAELGRAATRAGSVTGKQRVLFILSLQGGAILAAGSDTAAEGIIAMAGGQNAVTGFEGYKTLTDEAVLAAAPDVILMMERGGDHGGAAEVQAHPALSQTPAAQAGRLLTMDGLYLLGFGPRTGQAALDLNAALYGPAG